MTTSSEGRARRGPFRVLLVLLLLAVVAGAVVVVREVRASGPEPSADAATATSTDRPPASSSAPPAAPSTSAAPSTAAPSTPAEPTFDRDQLSITDPASLWVVVDKALPLSPLEYAPTDLVPIAGRELRAEAAQALTDLFAAASADGLTLSVQSAYRSYDYQLNTFRNQVDRFGQAKAEVQVARPGYSEHQTGLAADIGGGGCDIESCFASTAEGQWVAANGYRFGFLIRYPDGKQDVTGFKYEPWHVRYVGVALATEMQRTGVSTMEEFFGLPAAPAYPS